MKKKSTAVSLTLLFSLVYFTSYVTRKNLGVIITAVVDGTVHTKALIGIALTCLSITYGFGQIINGIIGDKTKPQNLIFCGLIIITLMNFLLPLFSASITLICILWAINGFAQAMIWPPIVKILAYNLSDKSYSNSVVLISTASALATICLSIFSKPIINLFGSWKAVFFVSAAIGLISCVIWLFNKDNFGDFQKAPTTNDSEEKTPKKRFNLSIPKLAIFPLIFIVITIVLQGMLRDGIEPLLPIFLESALGWTAEDAIIITLAPSILTVGIYYLSKWLYEKFFKNEVSLAGIIFGFSAFFAVVLTVLFIIMDIDVDNLSSASPFAKIAPIVCLTIVTSFMHGVNLMLNCQVPKRFVKYGNVSTLAGAINACTYLGSAIAYPLFLSLNWFTTVILCAVIAVVGAICCFIASYKWKKFAFPKEETVATEETAN